MVLTVRLWSSCLTVFSPKRQIQSIPFNILKETSVLKGALRGGVVVRVKDMETRVLGNRINNIHALTLTPPREMRRIFWHTS